jgi:hypothetical protein
MGMQDEPECLLDQRFIFRNLFRRSEQCRHSGISYGGNAVSVEPVRTGLPGTGLNSLLPSLASIYRDERISLPKTLDESPVS